MKFEDLLKWNRIWKQFLFLQKILFYYDLYCVSWFLLNLLIVFIQLTKLAIEGENYNVYWELNQDSSVYGSNNSRVSSLIAS